MSSAYISLKHEIYRNNFNFNYVSSKPFAMISRLKITILIDRSLAQFSALNPELPVYLPYFIAAALHYSDQLQLMVQF
ncbi:hypothetical protein NH340_JMT00100 [Sarcoptes scabiei]|nr:hypothetical protein NH340_JMT00100 [Sarcoptes scabiei]